MVRLFDSASGAGRWGIAALVMTLASAAAPAATCPYQVDDGTAENAFGPGIDVFWCNAFEADGCFAIQSVQVAFGPVGPAAPVRLFIYGDGSLFGDGSPENAVLLAAPTLATTANEDADVLNTYLLDEPVVVGGTFFVGAAVEGGAGEFPAAIDQDSAPAGASWIAFNLSNPDDPLDNPGTLDLIGDFGATFDGNWRLRAYGTDSSTALFCPGDTNNDLDIDVNDIIAVVSTWGTDGQGLPGINADVVPDGVVNVDDLTAVIGNWGPCPFNDEWFEAIPLSVTVGSTISVSFTMDGATLDEDLIQPSCFKDVTRDVWFSVDAIDPLGGHVSIDTVGSDFDTVIEAFTVPAGTPPTPAGSRDCDDLEVGPCIDQVLVRVAARGDGTGTGVLNVTAEGFICEAFGLCPGIPGSPSGTYIDQTITAVHQPQAFLCVGPEAFGTVGTWLTSFFGTGNEITASLCGTTEDFDSRIMILCGDGYTCDDLGCVASDDNGCGTPGGHASVTWCSEPGVRYSVLIYNDIGDSGNFEMTVTEGGPCADPVCEPPIYNANDDCVDALPVTDGLTPYSTLPTTTDGPAHPACATGQDGGVTANDAWFSYVPWFHGVLRVSTCDLFGGLAEHDSDLVVYDADAVPDPACAHLADALIACSDDDPDRPCGGPPFYRSTIEVDVEAGREYLIRVGDWADGHRATGCCSWSFFPLRDGHLARPYPHRVTTPGTPPTRNPAMPRSNRAVLRSSLALVAAVLLAVAVAPGDDAPPPEIVLDTVHWCFADEATGEFVDGGIVELPGRSVGDGGIAGVIPADAFTMIDNGPSANRIDLVFVGDGYLDTQLATYVAHLNNGIDELFSQEPFVTYGPYFNVHRVNVISPESGVDNDPNPGIDRDTALDMAFWCSGIERLLCVNVNKAYDYALNAPEVDHVFAVANSSKYGGAGYIASDLATFSGGNGAAPEVAIHEMSCPEAASAARDSASGSNVKSSIVSVKPSIRVSVPSSVLVTTSVPS